ncbi:HDEL receptor [Schizosaccharomyces japonicus yFS275]|uniref:ER lumen protein-retaining receptor n=1 Tax=Schizosaccharomyces japonicus (strain yFS275 / FY16936) TaxID=402676 RepID=B6K2F0_SCHJY|nr:HDEL receptor [Schizosaccharomyces japonicus yFS275]EEB07331.1 HDEL receptor [Schizosaccharomyces japonicus yFS275]
MSFFSALGDMSHVAAILLLIHKIKRTRSCAGISFKSQLLFLIVYVSRYLNILWHYGSLYFYVMRLVFIIAEAYICYLMLVPLRPTNDKRIDTFRIEYLVGGSAILALITTTNYRVATILWTFSIWLESVAILPQLFMLQRSGEAENLTAHYLLAMCLYRGLYLPHWVVRIVRRLPVRWVTIVAGLIQTVLYADFAVVYRRTVLQGKKFRLPS